MEAEFELMTAKDIAILFRMSPHYVSDKLTHRKDFPTPYRIGRVRRWPKNLIIDWLESRKK
jgi:predicted DNA-binding transcriptional regulator AlpA